MSKLGRSPEALAVTAVFTAAISGAIDANSPSLEIINAASHNAAIRRLIDAQYADGVLTATGSEGYTLFFDSPIGTPETGLRQFGRCVELTAEMHLRQEPSKDSASLGLLPPGTQLTLNGIAVFDEINGINFLGVDGGYLADIGNHVDCPTDQVAQPAAAAVEAVMVEAAPAIEAGSPPPDGIGGVEAYNNRYYRGIPAGLTVQQVDAILNIIRENTIPYELSCSGYPEVIAFVSWEEMQRFNVPGYGLVWGQRNYGYLDGNGNLTPAIGPLNSCSGLVNVVFVLNSLSWEDMLITLAHEYSHLRGGVHGPESPAEARDDADDLYYLHEDATPWSDAYYVEKVIRAVLNNQCFDDICRRIRAILFG